MTNSTVAVIEIPTGSTYKYEVDKNTDKLILDRILKMPIPYNYGYLKNTLSPDGDPLDVCLINEDPIVPLTVVSAIPIGVLICDDNGVSDDKILAVLEGSIFSKAYIEHRIQQISDFLSNYKEGFKVLDFKGIVEANETYEKSVISHSEAQAKLEYENRFKTDTVLT